MSRAQRSPAEVEADHWRDLERRARSLGVEWLRTERGGAIVRHGGRTWACSDTTTAEAALRCCASAPRWDAVHDTEGGAL